ncbi:MAG TPA: hypothetical protein VKF38_08730 [Anaerolineaceae bacterium]|nr:hypothetical protein [Anaerolineaceae bacterium]
MLQNHWEIVRNLQEIHQQDLMREAQQMRLYKQMVSAKSPTNPLSWRFFSWLGRQMVSLGSQMQKHYPDQSELSSDLQTNLSMEEPYGY